MLLLLTVLLLEVLEIHLVVDWCLLPVDDLSLDLAVFDVQDAVRVDLDVRIVGCHHHGYWLSVLLVVSVVVEAQKQVHDFDRVQSVDISSWFIEKKNLWMVGERSRNCTRLDLCFTLVVVLLLKALKEDGSFVLASQRS